MFGQLIHYWNLTGDDQYNDKTKQALLFQIGDTKNYMPQNQSKDLVRLDAKDPDSLAADIVEG